MGGIKKRTETLLGRLFFSSARAPREKPEKGEAEKNELDRHDENLGERTGIF